MVCAMIGREGKKSMAEQLPDPAIANAVERSLRLDARLTEEQVSVKVQDGVVRLLGYVSTPEQQKLAARLAERVAAVRQVINDLPVVAGRRSDVDLTADVVSALSQQPEIDLDTIEIFTVDGVVYLRGSVPTETARKVAEDTARSVDGVLDVIDELVVQPPVTRSEEEIAADVRQRILAALRIDPQQLDVHVENGVAILRGSVSHAELRMLADEVARWTPGVLDVRNELVTCPEAA